MKKEIVVSPIRLLHFLSKCFSFLFLCLHYYLCLSCDLVFVKVYKEWTWYLQEQRSISKFIWGSIISTWRVFLGVRVWSLLSPDRILWSKNEFTHIHRFTCTHMYTHTHTHTHTHAAGFHWIRSTWLAPQRNKRYRFPKNVISHFFPLAMLFEPLKEFYLDPLKSSHKLSFNTPTIANHKLQSQNYMICKSP